MGELATTVVIGLFYVLLFVMASALVEGLAVVHERWINRRRK